MTRLLYTLLAPALFIATLLTGSVASATPAQTAELHLPFAANDWQVKFWFTFAELADAESRIPNPLEFWAEYVDCEYYPGSDPNVEIQLWFCTQPAEVDAEGNPVPGPKYYFWFEPATDRVEWLIYSMTAWPLEVQP